MHGLFTTNGSTGSTVKLASETHVHVDGTFESGAVVLEYLSGDATWRAIKDESYTANADSFFSSTYGRQFRLTLAGATDETIAAQDETDFDGVGSNGTFGAGDAGEGNETIADQDETDFDGVSANGTFIGGDGSTPSAETIASQDETDYTLVSNATSLAFDATGDPDTITRTGGTSFITLGFGVGQIITIAAAEDAGNNADYTISAVTATIITVTEAIATTNTDDTSATLTAVNFVGGDGAGGTAYVALDTITLSDGSVITVDTVDGDDDVLTFTVTTKSATLFDFPTVTALTQSATSGTGTDFVLTVASVNVVDTQRYVVSDTITLSEGTVITVDAIDTSNQVTDFTVTTNSTGTFDFPTVSNLTQTSTSGVGVGFEITVGVDNVSDTTVYAATDTITMNEGSVITVDVVDADGQVTDFTVTSKSTTDAGGPTAVLTQASTDGVGAGFTLSLGVANVVAPAIFFEIS